MQVELLIISLAITDKLVWLIFCMVQRNWSQCLHHRSHNFKSIQMTFHHTQLEPTMISDFMLCLCRLQVNHVSQVLLLVGWVSSPAIYRLVNNALVCHKLTWHYCIIMPYLQLQRVEHSILYQRSTSYTTEVHNLVGVVIPFHSINTRYIYITLSCCVEGLHLKSFPMITTATF